MPSEEVDSKTTASGQNRVTGETDLFSCLKQLSSKKKYYRRVFSYQMIDSSVQWSVREVKKKKKMRWPYSDCPRLVSGEYFQATIQRVEESRPQCRHDQG